MCVLTRYLSLNISINLSIYLSQYVYIYRKENNRTGKKNVVTKWIKFSFFPFFIFVDVKFSAFFLRLFPFFPVSSLLIYYENSIKFTTARQSIWLAFSPFLASIKSRWQRYSFWKIRIPFSIFNPCPQWFTSRAHTHHISLKSRATPETLMACLSCNGYGSELLYQWIGSFLSSCQQSSLMNKETHRFSKKKKWFEKFYIGILCACYFSLFASMGNVYWLHLPINSCYVVFFKIWRPCETG